MRLRRGDRAFLLIGALGGVGRAELPSPAVALLRRVLRGTSSSSCRPLALLAVAGRRGHGGRLGRGGRARSRVRVDPRAAVVLGVPGALRDRALVTDHNISGLTCLGYRDYAGASREFAAARMLSPRNPLSRLGDGFDAPPPRPLARGAEPPSRAWSGIFPTTPWAISRWAIVLAGEGRREEALAQFKAANRLDPEDASIRTVLDSALAHEK